MTNPTPARPRVIYDLDHPDFPHGQHVGYSRGCQRECCLAARRRREKQLILGAPPKKQCASPETMRRVVAHVTALLEIPGNGYAAIGRAGGVGETTIRNLMVYGANLSPASAKKILAVRPDAVAATSRVVDAAPIVLLVGQMQALGYPVTWQEKKTGLDGIIRCLQSEFNRGKQPTVARATAELIRALAASIGDRPASDADGIAKATRTFITRRARENGYYPPAFYNEDGTLDYRSIPDHPWSITEEWCHDHIERLRLALKHPDLYELPLARLTNPALPAECNEERQYGRLLDRLQLRPSHEGSDQRRAELADALHDFFSGEGDPLTFCLDHNLAKVTAQKIARDHPSLLAHPAHKARMDARAESRRQSIERANEVRRQQRIAARAARSAAKQDEQVAA